MIIADTSGLLAAFDRSERRHAAVIPHLTGSEALVVSPYVVAELGQLVGTRMGTRSEVQVMTELAGGGYELACLDRQDVLRAVDVMERYADLDIGITDASLVVLSERHGTTDILTLDERHFRVLQPLQGGSFTLLPADV